MYVFGVFNTNKNSESWDNDYFDLNKVSKQLIKIQTERGSSLIYNTSARRERHKCDTIATRATLLQQEWERATRVWHKCDTSATPTTRVRHEWNFDFDNYTYKNIFSHSYIYYMASERLQGEEQFYFKYYLWNCLIPMPQCVWKVHQLNQNVIH